MKKMRAVQVSRAKGPFEMIEREVPEPPAGHVRLRVEACGICHSDALTKEGIWPGIQYPRVPGHEVAGTVDAVGGGVAGWKAGDRAGVGWHGGHCGYCDACRRGQFVLCEIAGQVSGITMDGGYADFMIVPSGALMCAGVTTFNSLRNAGARPGEMVAVLGIGGLGHLGVQFSVRSGFRTVAIARGKDKEALSLKLGAHHYIDSQSQDPAKELQALGGARLVLATVTDGKAMGAVLGGLGRDGKLLVLGGPRDNLEVPPVLLISGRRAVAGWASGSSIDSEDTLAFSALTGVRSMNELYPLSRAQDAYDRMMSGKARFRVVLTTQT
jgi:D-arabinose 1-dehydrogenase-like Zn-dependent alcohol dehydrogenase